MPKKILVTGGAGFIGSHLCDELIKQGHEVVALDNLANGKEENLAEAKSSESFRFIKGDILNQQDCKEAVEGIDVIYHLACLGVRHSLHDPLMNHRVNAEGTLNMLEAARLHKVKKFFYISSSEVYGDIVSFPITEEGLPKPKTVYGSSKLVGEYYAYSYHTCFDVETTVLRIFNNYGPRAHYEGDSGEIIPRTIVMALYGKAPVIFGDGMITRDFFYVKDTAKALTGLLDIEGLAGQTINIGTGEEITMKTLINTILKEMELTDSLQVDFMPDRPADVVRLWVNAAKFRKITGFTGDTSFNDGLKETIAFYRDLASRKEIINELKVINWK